MFLLILTIIITSLTKTPLITTPVPLTLKVNTPSNIKKAIINNLISHEKLISSFKTIFHKEIKNIKQTLINNGFPNYIVDDELNI